MTARLKAVAANAPSETAKPAFPELARDDVFMIGTRRLWLRWPRLDDADAIARFSGDARVAVTTGTWPVGCDADYASARIAKVRAGNAAGTGFAFIVARRDSWGEPIGMMGFNVLGSTDGLVAVGGYHLDPAHWGQGYASEALASIVGMIRLLTRIDTLRADVMPHNVASQRVLEKNGFVPTGSATTTTEARGTFNLVRYERVLRPVRVSR